MKKMKKFFAMFLALAMVLGMSVTTFAAPKEEATIKVVDASGATINSATFTYVQIIKPAPETITGWDFSTDEIAAAYLEAFQKTNSPENRQSVIQGLIDLREKSTDPNGIVKSNEIGVALNNVASTSSGVTFESMANPLTVKSAGVYEIVAIEDGYTYVKMAAYVGFGEIKENDEVVNAYPSLMDVTLTAKRSATTLTKESADTDKFVAIGDTKSYTITHTVPAIDPNEDSTLTAYHIYDYLDGATYDANPLSLAGALPENYVADETILTNIVVTVGGVAVDSTKATIKSLTGDELSFKRTENGVEETYGPFERGFDLDLSGYIDDANSFAGQEVVVTYTTTVTATTVSNTAFGGPNKDQPSYGSDTDNLFTGEIELLKYAAGDRTNVLAGAEFEVYKQNGVDGENNPVWEQIGFDTPNNGVYKFNKTVATGTIKTGTNGKVKVEGLGDGTYKFVETVAPTGYHIGEEDSIEPVTLTVGEGTASAIITVDTVEVPNTTLSSLPSTGGIGTTIFTIGGCAIMIIAAGLYFSLRRRTVK